MLTENQVVIAMRTWLQNSGYTISSHKLDTQSGHDIEAVKGERTIYIECKGGISKKNWPTLQHRLSVESDIGGLL